MERLRGLRDDASMRKFESTQKRHIQLLRNQNEYWKQRAKERWYKEGDCNSKFFHTSVNQRRCRNRLRGLKNSQGIWTTDEQGIGNIVLDYFETLYASEKGDFRPVLECLETKITPSQNAMLTHILSMEEVKAAVFSMQPDKSPGPDGLSPGFFQMHWDVLGDEVLSFCQSFINTGHLPKNINHTHIILIPKKKQPEHMTDMRPIALSNVIYRILAKVLANRMKSVLNSVISENQSAFIPGRSIIDNVMIAYESIHALNRQRGNKGGHGALTIDMSKAYDRLEWEFLEAVLIKLGFSDQWVSMMKECFSTVTYQVLIDGGEWGPIIPSRGLRQGDPLSPCLFILAAEGLSAMLRVQESSGGLHGISVARGAPMVSHLFFADDCLFFFRANCLEAGILREVLEEYGNASGQKINLEKSSILFGRNVHRMDKEAVCETLGVHEQQGRRKYLGLPGYVGRRKKEILGYIRDRMRGRIMNWGNRFLSRAGKEVLLKTVLQSIPNYAMNVFLLPKGLCEELERLMNAFWWGCERREGRGIRWSTWGDLCKPKPYGGMGFRTIREMNIAMLGKQGWKFIQNHDALVTKVFKSRYFPKCSFLEAKHGSNPSFVWSSIFESQHLLKQGCRWRVGEGRDIKVWGEPWLPDDNNPYVSTPEPPYLAGALVNSLFQPGTTHWDEELLNDIFCERDAKLILKLPTSFIDRKDSLFWIGEENGSYSVKSAYKMLKGDVSHLRKLEWTEVWNLNLPPKIKCFFWNLCTKRLPTKDALIVKQVRCDPLCLLCGVENESVLHVFVTCGFAKQCWRQLNLEWHVDDDDTVTDWVKEMWKRLDKRKCEQAIVVCWAMWEARNNMLWKGQSMDPRSLTQHSWYYIHNWQQAHAVAHTAPMRDISTTCRWTPPPHGTIKVNIDIAMDKQQNRMGFGWVARDAEGVVIAAVSWSTTSILSVPEAEAMGAREALSWIKDRGWTKVIVESDAQIVTKAVNASKDILSPFGLLIDDIHVMLSEMNSVMLCFEKRAANMVAHTLAKGALLSPIGFEWTDSVPRCISDFVCFDRE